MQRLSNIAGAKAEMHAAFADLNLATHLSSSVGGQRRHPRETQLPSRKTLQSNYTAADVQICTEGSSKADFRETESMFSAVAVLRNLLIVS